MNNLPSPEHCLTLLRDHGCSEGVIAHCCAVRDLALQIAQRTTANLQFVETGALLHDIGRGTTQGIKHAIVGAQIARDLGLPSEIIHIIERHIGAGIPENEAVRLGLPKKNYIPETLEEKIVTHADNLIEDHKKVPISYEIEKAEQKHKYTYAQRLRALHNELSKLCGIDLDYL
jgi:uncharacterized protein (TIGR00295 family)